MSYEIEMDVPIVKMASGQKRGDVTNALIKLAHSPIGASIMFPGKTTDRMSTCIFKYRANLDGAKLKCRTVDGGVRVWRIA